MSEKKEEIAIKGLRLTARETILIIEKQQKRIEALEFELKNLNIQLDQVEQQARKNIWSLGRDIWSLEREINLLKQRHNDKGGS